MLQLYMTCLLGVIPLPATVQNEILPVVRANTPLPDPPTSLTITVATSVGHRVARRIPPLQSWLRRLLFQRCT